MEERERARGGDKGETEDTLNSAREGEGPASDFWLRDRTRDRLILACHGNVTAINHPTDWQWL
eukprot:1133451-Rhodomonas_salina.1